MSRLASVRPNGRGWSLEGPATDYLERVAKYIPGEILAAYLSINGILASVTDPSQQDLRKTCYVASFALCLVLTPIYIKLLSKKDSVKIGLHMVISSVAFIIWAYSLGGMFELFQMYVPFIGSILLIFFTLISGLYAPKPA